MTLGERIKKLRIKEKMTQAELAESVGISTMSLQRYESGVRTPKPEIIEKIAYALCVETMELFGLSSVKIGSTFEKFNNYIATMGYAIYSGITNLATGTFTPFPDNKVLLGRSKIENGELGDLIEKVELTQTELETLLNTSKAVIRGLLDDILDRGNNQAEQAENKGE